MRNIKLVLEYDGSNYYGWQVQRDLTTIQGTVQDALKKIIREEVTITAAGRTDTGVHAWMQVCNFKTVSSLPAHSFMRGLNSLLPGDIVIKYSADVAYDFNARRSVTSKTYKYILINRSFPSAIYRNFSWLVCHKLDLEAMVEGAKLFVGEKDFSSFRAVGCSSPHAIRSIDHFAINEASDGFIHIEVKGKAFLRHMVRIMVGTLVDLGRGKIDLSNLEEIIEAKDRTCAGETAPPQGLFLKEVEY
jgi:tRNA pseudouridine38-40 synthase